MAAVARRAAQLLEVLDADRSIGGRAFDERVQDVKGRTRIVERTVVRGIGYAEVLRERAEPHVTHLVADQSACEHGRVDHPRAQRRQVEPYGGGPEKAEVEAGVVRDEHGVTDEVDDGRYHRRDVGRAGHVGIGDTGDRSHRSRDGDTGMDEGPELGEHLAATRTDRADLRDAVPVR